MSPQLARYWAEPLTALLLSDFGITPKQFGELAGGERLTILASLERRGIERKLKERQAEAELRR